MTLVLRQCKETHGNIRQSSEEAESRLILSGVKMIAENRGQCVHITDATQFKTRDDWSLIA